MPDPAPVDRLRRVVQRVRLGRPPRSDDLEWLVAGAERHLAEPETQRFGVALGLEPGRRGEKGWWSLEPKAKREAVVAEMDRQLCKGLKVPEAARRLRQLARRLSENGDGVPLNAATLLVQLNSVGGLPGEKQVQNIVARHRKSNRD